eukprot:714264-Amphidinium_carterae.1
MVEGDMSGSVRICPCVMRSFMSSERTVRRMACHTLRKGRNPAYSGRKCTCKSREPRLLDLCENSLASHF